MPLASSALLPSVPGTLPATHVVSSHLFILVGTDLKHWKISIKKSCGRSIGFPETERLTNEWKFTEIKLAHKQTKQQPVFEAHE